MLTFIVLALFAPWIAPQDPVATSWSAIRQAPSHAHLFGTDEIGRDVLSRVVWGTQASLLAGLVSVSISLLLGVPIGMAAGFLGGAVDMLISRVTDAFLACPFLILAIALAAFLGPSLTNAMIAIGVSATPIFVRLTRAQVLNVKVEDYVEAARAVGNPPWRIAWRHVLPNVLPSITVVATFSVARTIIAEASLSFLGLGIPPPAPSWGAMLDEGRNYLTTGWWLALFLPFLLTAFIETAQRGIPGRVSDPRDVLANTLGGIAGVVLGMILTLPATLRRQRRKRKRVAPEYGS